MGITIYFVRHGETVFNKQDRFNGQPGSPLNETGRTQAREASLKLTDIKFDVVYASPLDRARETCEIILAGNKYGGTIILDDRIKERCFGIYEGEEISKTSIVGANWWQIGNEPFIEGGETIADMLKRVGAFADDLKKNYSSVSEHKTILIVAHGGVYRAFFYTLNEKPKDGNLIKDTTLNNCDIRIFDIV